MSLREFARRLGVSAPFWSDVELGRRYPSDDTLRHAAKLLGESSDELKQYDTRPPVEDLKRLSREDPAYGFAFRQMIDQGLSSEELLEMVREREEKKSKRSDEK